MKDILASLIVAALGALIIFVVQRVSRRLRDRKLRTRYPVAGLFTTEFEDRQGDTIVIERGLTRLRQRGTEVRGVTSELQFGRCWEMEGHISSNGFLHGIYTAEDPHDSGMGTFFLRISGSSGDLDGLWAGYDSVNSSLTGGRYTFRRCPDAEVRPATSADYHAIVALLGDALGDRYIGLEQLEEMKPSARETCFVAHSEGRLAGAAIARHVSREALATVFPEGQAKIMNALPLGQYHRTIGIVSAVAVSPDTRGRGLGTRLTRASMDWLRDQGATLALSFGWKSSNGCHIAGVLESCGFDAKVEVQDFWTKESATVGYSCPECGDVCTCAAVIFVRSLSDLPPVRCNV